MTDPTDVLVTGAAKGIGYAIAQRFAVEGHRVALLDNDAEVLDASCAKLSAEFPATRIDGFVCDVASLDYVNHTFEVLDASGWAIGVTVNNAGIFPRQDSLDMTPNDWGRVIGVNLTGAFYVACESARRMVARGGGGVILQMISGQAFRPSGRGTHYAASKGGLVGMTRSLAMEWAQDGIRVNAVVPGLARTDQPLGEFTPDELEEKGRTIPLGRIGEPEDIASVAYFLASSEASYITGQSLMVNGGSIMG